ncbi:16770_t:CDS:2, partial [Gigaspora rosea]
SNCIISKKYFDISRHWRRSYTENNSNNFNIFIQLENLLYDESLSGDKWSFTICENDAAKAL